MHQQAFAFVQRALADIPTKGARVCEFGAYDVNATAQGLRVRDLCAGCASYIGIDARPGPGVDRVTSAQDLLVGDLPARPDLIICCETLEHDADPSGIVAAALRLLAPGGALILTAAGEGRPPHGVDGGALGNEPYQTISEADLRAWLAAWEDVQIAIDAVACDIYAVARKPADAAPKPRRKEE